MKNIILSVATSLDGYIEGPNREVDWLSFSEDTAQVLEKFLDEIDTVFYGRVSYEAWGNYVPAEEGSDFEKSFYRRLNKMRKVVFSTTKDDFAGEPFVIKNDVENAVAVLKRESGKNIWLYGGADLVTAFVNYNLVDEYRIAVFPIILGSGRPLFKGISHRVELKLQHVTSGKSGVVEYCYRKG
jgi:dihydrofolate reductase